MSKLLDNLSKHKLPTITVTLFLLFLIYHIVHDMRELALIFIESFAILLLSSISLCVEMQEFNNDFLIFFANIKRRYIRSINLPEKMSADRAVIGIVILAIIGLIASLYSFIGYVANSYFIEEKLLDEILGTILSILIAAGCLMILSFIGMKYATEKSINLIQEIVHSLPKNHEY